MPPFPCIPSATYRLQFHQGFTFLDAKKIVPYLSQLGISHLYASPIFRASPGSIHGYDISDHNELNPELGSREDFDALLQELEKHHLKLILDFVPNHMGVSEASNLWWMSVLEDGPSSPYAHCFDIDWSPLKVEMEGKVLLAILEDQYGRVLERGEFSVVFNDGSLFIQYGDRYLPTAPHTLIPMLKRVVDLLSPEPPIELESIIYSIEHLPSNHETDEAGIREKAREKQLIRSRLARLYEESSEVRQGIQTALTSLYAPGEGGDYDALDELIQAQSYRLAYWRVASEEINYRRFFDVNDLAALRMHQPEVFEATHRLVTDLLASETVTGLRIDHIDGLSDPQGYLEKLQGLYAELHDQPVENKPLYLLVEKILIHDEGLRTEWPVHGTTGYEFATQATNVLVNGHSAVRMTKSYERFTGMNRSFADCMYQGKLLVMRTTMPSEVNMLAHMLHRLCQTNRWYRDFTLNALEAALREVIACFPVYRSYITPGQPVTHEDHRLVLRAIAAARRRNPDMERTVFEFLRDVLLPPAMNAHPVDEPTRQEFVRRFQQSTGPIMAKGVEDTAFYVYNRLVALNEVGGEPGNFGADIATFHRLNEARAAHWPACMLTTSTHDTKRSEDVRARIAVLSEFPHEWEKALRFWQRCNQKYRTEIEGFPAPDANEESLFYQTLMGSWPLHPMSPGERRVYIERLQHYMVKALHEAKVNSSWIEPHKEWDQAVRDYVERVLTNGSSRFESSLQNFVQRVAQAGAINSLTQTVLKLTSPGVPDTYQGQEMWDFSLVDPDNRRPVDYAVRQAALAEDLPSVQSLLETWQDGKIKLWVTHRLLHLRKELPELFLNGGYEALIIEGELSDHVVAYRRRHGEVVVDVVVPRWIAAMRSPPLGDCWGNTRVKLGSLTASWNVLTQETLELEDGYAALKEIFKDFPVAVFRSRPL
ncbi:maltooligosyl trehalose synthase [Prosthecobacter debontii]|uniref:Maltooligosyl trehalose synthase n=1 Tax=Prosthecobacter debontii TaxID=48467 RepID=A0A1T4YGQ1_9BACT|nr:malto-oligosyltrehalose synthase [Prosthecobacter debontii]SKB01012.1 maltooligosyl trehalose synthase [Prosthecobacter debontii]